MTTTETVPSKERDRSTAKGKRPDDGIVFVEDVRLLGLRQVLFTAPRSPAWPPVGKTEARRTWRIPSRP